MKIFNYLLFIFLGINFNPHFTQGSLFSYREFIFNANMEFINLRLPKYCPNSNLNSQTASRMGEFLYCLLS